MALPGFQSGAFQAAFQQGVAVPAGGGVAWKLYVPAGRAPPEKRIMAATGLAGVLFTAAAVGVAVRQPGGELDEEETLLPALLAALWR